MGSVDIPPFLRKKQKEQTESSNANVPPFLKKKDTANLNDGGNESEINTSESAIDYKNNFFTRNQFNEPVIETENGSQLAVPSKALPVTPFANQQDYITGVQKRIKSGTKTAQDETFIDNVRKANSNFTPDDDFELSTIAQKYHIPSEYPDLDSRLVAVKQLKELIPQQQEEEDNQFQSSGGTGGVMTYVKDAGKPKEKRADEYERLNYLEKKLAIEKNKTDTYPIIIDAEVRTDNSGNLLKKALAGIALLNPSSNIAGQIAVSQQTVDHLERQVPEFSLGLNGLKYTEPEQYKRVTKMLSDGAPLSESMVANITAQGLDTKESIVKDAYVRGDITAHEYKQETEKIQRTRYDNIVNNKETLRAFLANGIANLGDDIKSPIEGINYNAKIFGHTWNYSDTEIEQLGKAYAQANGIDPNDANVKEALKYLQDNEGAMIMANSIAKSGYVRDLAKGLATPIRGLYNTVEGIGKSESDKYTESQSQGNVNVSEDKVQRIKSSPVESAVSDVLEGTGQFLTQAALAALTSGTIGAVGKGLQASNLGATTAGELIGTAPKIGNMLLGSKDALSTFITSYAQVYDSNLKQALSYTADDDKAKVTAGIMSGLEGATELFLSPLEIAQGIGNKLLNKKKITKSVVDVLSDAAIVDKNAAIKNKLKSILKGTLESGKVALAEIGEEEVTQIADYAANAMLNPDSKSFQNRDLLNEVGNTAYQTGLSMALPALASGAGAYKVNNFSKGSLLIAAQNRQQLIDDMKQRVHDGTMSQSEFNEKAEIINTAAKSNELLPVKDDGKKLNTQEKANYIYSRVSEAILNKKLKILEEDKSRGVGKIGEGEDATNVEDPEITQIKKKIESQVLYRSKILSSKPQYYADNEPVTKDEFNDILKSEDRDKYDLSVENDKKMQDKLLNVEVEPEIKPIIPVEEKKEEVIEEKPIDELAGIEEEDTDLATEKQQPKETPAPLFDQAKEIVNTDGAVKGFTASILKESANSNPIEFNQHLKDISEQAYDPRSEKRTIETYGQELVDIAKQLNPKQSESQPIELSTEVSKPSGVVESFETSKGSVYTVLPDGRTQRFKTKTNEQKEPQDLTVFAKFEGQKEDDYLQALHGVNGETVHVAGIIDGKVQEIKTNDEAAKAEGIKIIIVDKDGKMVSKVDATIKPTEGYTVFDQRKVGENSYEKHIGNEVSKINYKPENKPINEGSQQSVPETKQSLLTNTKQNETGNKETSKSSETASNTTGGEKTEGKTRKRFKGIRKANREIRHPEQVKALQHEVIEPYDMAIQYFIGGGKINSNALKKLFSNKAGTKAYNKEVLARVDILNKTAPGLSEVAHSMWDNLPENLQDKYSSQDFENAIEAVLLDTTSRTKMAQSLNERFAGGKVEKTKYSPEEEAYIKWLEQTYDDAGSEEAVNDAIGIVSSLTDEEAQRLLDEEKAGQDFYFNQLVQQHEEEAKINKVNQFDEEQKTFDEKIDEVADRIIKALTPKGMEGVKANGITIENLIRAAAYAIKKSYRAGVEINKAIDDAVSFIKEKWQDAFGEFNEDAIRAELSKIPNTLPSEKNRKIIDVQVDKIVDGKVLKSKVIADIKTLPVSDVTKDKLLNYLNDELKEKRRGTYAGLDENEKAFYNNYEEQFLNGQMPYEDIMHLLGSIADTQSTLELREKYNNIRDIFYKENHKRAERNVKEEKVKEYKNFNDDINNTRLGLSDTEISNFKSDIRLLRDSDLNFTDDTSFLENNDQLKSAFEFDQYAQDMDAMIGKFQRQYGEKYLDAMVNFIENGDNQLDARVSVSVALNNHLKYLSDTTDNPLKKIKYRSLEEKNAKISQELGRRGSLLLNSLRAWNKDLISDFAWVGIVNPDLQQRASEIKSVLGSDISDEDLLLEDEGKLDIFEQEETKDEVEQPAKSANYFKKNKASKNAKVTNVKSQSQLKKDIEEQKKNCK